MWGNFGINPIMFRFSEFELNLDRYELRRDGTPVKAEPRVLEVLNYLIEHRDRVVPKEELLDKLWPDVHVSESALTTAIRDARRALGDSSRRPVHRACPKSGWRSSCYNPKSRRRQGRRGSTRGGNEHEELPG